jgi:glycosyltransferase involved in cell wall biosynthesis
VRLGFACVWDADPRRTWSYTPWELRAALRRQAGAEAVPDVGITVPKMARTALRMAATRRKGGRWVAPWEQLAPWERWSEAHVDLRARIQHCDAMLQIQDIGVVRTPYFLYQDLSYDVVLRLLDEGSDGLRHYFPHLDRATVLRRRDRQLRIYEHAAGVLTMSRFLAESLVKDTGLDSSKVHTVSPGASARAPGHATTPPGDHHRRVGQRRRLLFVGTTFWVKGGDTVVAALEILRREVDPAITLTIAGPDHWPLAGGIPEGVRFLGRVEADEVAALYDAHDLLVVPSRLEGFGKVFLEALSHGMPCVGRDAFAMPELITPERGGLVHSEDPAELATCINSVLTDDAIFDHCAVHADQVVENFTWDRAAATTLAIVEQTLAIRA